MPVSPLLVVRADGGPATGSGHLARCLALVQAWTDLGGRAVLQSHEPPKFWWDRYLAEGCAVQEPSRAHPHAAWRVVDGYTLTRDDHGGSSDHLLIIDDFNASGTRGAGADLVLDQNLGAEPEHYDLAGTVLAGSDFVLLRREIVRAAFSASTRSRDPNEPPRVLVLLGGAPDATVRTLGSRITTDPRLRGLTIEALGGADPIEEAMMRADVAVSAAGSVSWELCRFGVPSVLMPVAPNQEPIATNLVAAGAALSVPPDSDLAVSALIALIADRALQQDLATRGRALVDGLGAGRVATTLREIWAANEAGISRQRG